MRIHQAHTLSLRFLETILIKINLKSHLSIDLCVLMAKTPRRLPRLWTWEKYRTETEHWMGESEGQFRHSSSLLFLLSATVVLYVWPVIVETIHFCKPPPEQK